MDFEAAKQYAHQVLSTQLKPYLTYHSLYHTFEEVAEAVDLMAPQSGLSDPELRLLQTAVYYHDIGFTRQLDEHEMVGVQIVREVLPRFGYTPSQIDVIANIIMATKLPQTPHTRAEAIMADADLFSLGAENFLERSFALRSERAATAGITYSDSAWFAFQIEFLSGHRYFTPSARSLRDPGKQRNIAMLHRLLEEAKTAEQE